MPSWSVLNASPVPVRAITCVGRNYLAHALELGNAPADEPVLFTKQPMALRPLDSGPLAWPDATYHYEAELVLRIGRDCELGEACGWEAVSHVALGLDLTRRDLQSELKAKGLPWTRAKSFLGAAPLGPLVPMAQIADPDALEYRFALNGEPRQHGRLTHMSFPIPVLLKAINAFAPLAEGDLVFTGTPEGVGECQRGDTFEFFLGDSLHWRGRL